MHENVTVVSKFILYFKLDCRWLVTLCINTAGRAVTALPFYVPYVFFHKLTPWKQLSKVNKRKSKLLVLEEARNTILHSPCILMSIPVLGVVSFLWLLRLREFSWLVIVWMEGIDHWVHLKTFCLPNRLEWWKKMANNVNDRVFCLFWSLDISFVHKHRDKQWLPEGDGGQYRD